jgi:hypothetical protein
MPKPFAQRERGAVRLSPSLIETPAVGTGAANLRNSPALPGHAKIPNDAAIHSRATDAQAIGACPASHIR